MRIRPTSDNHCMFRLRHAAEFKQDIQSDYPTALVRPMQTLGIQQDPNQTNLSAFLDAVLTELEELEDRYDPSGVSNQHLAYECRYCHKKFDKSTALGGHISKIHKDNTAPQEQIYQGEPKLQGRIKQMVESTASNSQLLIDSEQVNGTEIKLQNGKVLQRKTKTNISKTKAIQKRRKP